MPVRNRCPMKRRSFGRSWQDWLGSLLLVGWLGGSSGCSQRPPLQANLEDPDMPPITMVIPDDVPLRIELEDKERKRSIGNGRDMYASTYRQGWQECWKRYKAGDLDPTDKNAEPSLVQEFGIQMRGRMDGFKNCRLAILQSQRAPKQP